MHRSIIALFGEAEKGDFRQAYLCESLPQLVDYLGHPPKTSQGLYLAVQTLMYHRALLFFRVREEGYSTSDYYYGLKILKETHELALAALCMPGVGDAEIIQASSRICTLHASILITNQQDLYDYLTSHRT